MWGEPWWFAFTYLFIHLLKDELEIECRVVCFTHEGGVRIDEVQEGILWLAAVGTFLFLLLFVHFLSFQLHGRTDVFLFGWGQFQFLHDLNLTN